LTYLIVLLIELIEITSNIIDDNKDEQKTSYTDDNLLYLILIMFIIPRFFTNIVFYKHQKISFLAFILIEVIKTVFFLIRKIIYEIFDYLTIIFNIIYSLFLAFLYLYIERLMKYKYISPYKCSFMIGVGIVPLIIIIYFIISFTTDFDNIFELFKDFEHLEINNIIIIIIYPFTSGLSILLMLKIVSNLFIILSKILLI
jgi:hypothetical protein